MMLMYNHHHESIKDYAKSYLKNKPPDCILFSEDGTEFKIQKELFCQTRFMRELLKSGKCCDTIDIICPCSKKELGQLIDFLVNGKIQCEDENDSSNVFENLTKILGFPTDLDSPGKFLRSQEFELRQMFLPMTFDTF